MFVRAQPCKDLVKAAGLTYSNEAEFGVAVNTALANINQALAQKCPTYMPEYTASVKSGDWSTLSAAADQCGASAVTGWKDFKKCVTCGDKAVGKCANAPAAHCVYEKCGQKKVQFTPLYWVAVAVAGIAAVGLVVYLVKRRK